MSSIAIRNRLATYRKMESNFLIPYTGNVLGIKERSRFFPRSEFSQATPAYREL